MKNKRSLKHCLFLVLGLIVTSCDLDYENTGVINPDNVWSDKVMISGYLSDIHGSMMPGWPYNGSDSDEAIHNAGIMPEYLRGMIGVEKNGVEFSYVNIDKINFLLDKLKDIEIDVLSVEENAHIEGQALFWRAWDYWGKVSILGGVPLILEVQDISNIESLFKPRSKTSECVVQIIADLDAAIAVLPEKWDDTNYGRIDKGAAMAFKGRVLLWYASPLFNTENDNSRWKEAYNANKAAVEFLESQGKGLYPDFKELWYDERNKEVVMLNQFIYPDHAYSNSNIRPDPITKDFANANQPIFNLLTAFPKKDGSDLILDVDRLADKAYNSQYLTDFYTNRDDRFYTTIFAGGTIYPTPDFTADTRYWSVWKKVVDEGSSSGFKHMSLAAEQMGGASNFGLSGFFQLKGIDKSLTKPLVHNAETDWIEIRFAEVLMNYGECANEIGVQSEALDVLYKIRKRANINAGNGTYGVTATTQTDVREAYIKERFVEFAFENKRFPDLRRWKRFDILNNQKHRSGLYLVLNEGNSTDDFDWTDDIKDPEIRKFFHAEYIRNLDGSDEFKFNLDLNHWFYPINKKDLDRNSKLEQNNEWGGDFDPLQ